MPPPSDSSSSDDDDAFGPTLPPHLAARKSAPQPQPQLPKRRPVAGPAAPPESHQAASHPAYSDDDDELFGPMPPPAGGYDAAGERDLQDRIAEVEERAQRARDEEERRSKPENIERGDWMLVPPEAHRLLPIMGDSMMKSRQFSKKAVPEDVDQSGWTETPQDKAAKGGEKRKRPAKDEPRAPTTEELQTRDFIRKHNETHRGGALMDQHMSSYVKDRKFEEEDVSQRRFDRDKDMGGQRKIDARSRQDMVDKARKLDTKFSHGSKTFL